MFEPGRKALNNKREIDQLIAQQKYKSEQIRKGYEPYPAQNQKHDVHQTEHKTHPENALSGDFSSVD